MDDRLFNFEIFTKNLSDIDNRINSIMDAYNPQAKTEYEDKKGVFSIFNAVKNCTFDFYCNRETIFKLIRKYQSQRLDKKLNKYSKHSKSVGEIENYYNATVKYLKSEQEKTIPETLKLNTRNKTGKR